MGTSRAWAAEAIATVERDAVITPLREVKLPPDWGVRLHLKDESAQPSGSVKHRLLGAAYADALASGQITEDTTVVMATAGPAAVAGAHFARLIGVEFMTVVPRSTKPEKIAAIEAVGGRCHPYHPPAAIYQEAQRLAADGGGFYLDHFAAAARVMDWRGDREHHIGAEIVAQLGRPPAWIVTGAGTGATSGTIGRFLRYRGYRTRLAVADPENSAYFPGWASGAPDYATGMPSRIEGIGRPRMEPGFLASAIDLVVPVPDAAAVGALTHLRSLAGITAGGSTGACLWAAWRLIDRMLSEGESGDVVVVMGDAGAAPGLDGTAYAEAVERFLTTGRLETP
ncbi:PLP-dependent cysteine synthase family protein [Thermomonospora catenispora]|uniref:PLP-dependent cysteine synthase family protein n=1 Tax=Thermomonospora catenispora TaxID=2493090 RepID=UPI0011236D86|nr:pyridoxal-phosphate dependent enzyme [Thermomonospora catenispora]TNY35128.1 pyridoxal-phosphate dependent enzyme [Thermomonospora catenispora]